MDEAELWRQGQHRRCCPSHEKRSSVLGLHTKESTLRNRLMSTNRLRKPFVLSAIRPRSSPRTGKMDGGVWWDEGAEVCWVNKVEKTWRQYLHFDCLPIWDRVVMIILINNTFYFKSPFRALKKPGLFLNSKYPNLKNPKQNALMQTTIIQILIYCGYIINNQI